MKEEKKEANVQKSDQDVCFAWGLLFSFFLVVFV